MLTLGSTGIRGHVLGTSQRNCPLRYGIYADAQPTATEGREMKNGSTTETVHIQPFIRSQKFCTGADISLYRYMIQETTFQHTPELSSSQGDQILHSYCLWIKLVQSMAHAVMTKNLSTELSKQLIDEKAKDALSGEGRWDLMIKAHNSLDPKAQLKLDELLAEVNWGSVIIFTGHTCRTAERQVIAIRIVLKWKMSMAGVLGAGQGSHVVILTTDLQYMTWNSIS
ncbi:hypothetical protein DFS33DRAFT_1271219 [Desarmillaria ectypa]|nr:hypothetical protein DFS33DRAFT_1271219 [Desarmillaria ectypa]